MIETQSQRIDCRIGNPEDQAIATLHSFAAPLQASEQRGSLEQLKQPPMQSVGIAAVVAAAAKG